MPRILMPGFAQVCWIYKLIRLETSLSIQIVVCLNCVCFPPLIICFLDATDEFHWTLKTKDIFKNNFLYTKLIFSKYTQVKKVTNLMG